MDAIFLLQALLYYSYLITTLNYRSSSFTFGIIQASLALPSLNHDLFPVHDINALWQRVTL